MLKRIAFFTLVFAFAGWVAVSPTMATKEFAQKEKKGCVTCHMKMGDKELNDAGKHYKEHKTLEGYKKKDPM